MKHRELEYVGEVECPKCHEISYVYCDGKKHKVLRKKREA